MVVESQVACRSLSWPVAVHDPPASPVLRTKDLFPGQLSVVAAFASGGIGGTVAAQSDQASEWAASPESPTRSLIPGALSLRLQHEIYLAQATEARWVRAATYDGAPPIADRIG